MTDDSQVPVVICELPSGVMDCPAYAADIATVGTVVRISANRTVRAIATSDSEATVRTALGRITKPFNTGDDNVVPVQTPWKRLEKFVAGGTVTYGEYVKYEYGTGALNGQVITWTPGTDDEDQIVGQVWYGGVDGGTVEVFTR